jgi:D-3-phosphoglycerate dehydrogenase
MAEPVVIAVGQTWPDLSTESAILAAQGIQIVDGRSFQPDDKAWSEAAGILLGTGYKLDSDRLKTLSRCRGVVRYGIGYDNVDIPAAEELGIPVGIVRDYCIEEVAEHAIAFALALARGLPHWDRNIRAGAWRSGPKQHLRRLSSLTFGLIGFGLIGRTVVEKARGLFGRILVFDPLTKPTQADLDAGTIFVDDLDTFLEQTDILSVHVPLTDGTRGMVDAAALARMKPTAIVINVSRGGIIDENALINAVSTGRIAGAGLDTFTKEPLPADHPLLQEPRILLSPHVAWLSEESEIKLRERASEELALILQGRTPSALVTKVNTRFGKGTA